MARRGASRGLGIAQLRKALVATRPDPVYLVLGAEDALRRRAYEALKSVFADGPAGTLTKLEGASSGVAEIVDEARTLPLFAALSEGPARLVWVSRYDKLSTDGIETLAEYVKNPVEGTCLVLEATKLDKRRALYKSVVANATLVACDPPESESDVRRWIAATVRAEGHGIDDDASAYLLEMVGTSITVLEQELEKAMLYAGVGGRIEARHLEGLLGRSREVSVFELTDALVRGDRNAALRLLNLLMDDGEEPIRLLAMIAWMTRQLVTAHDVAASGCSKQEAMNAIGGRWQQRGDILRRAGRAQRDGLLAALSACADADLFIKRLRDSRPGADRLRPSRGRLEALCRQICAA